MKIPLLSLILPLLLFLGLAKSQRRLQTITPTEKEYLALCTFVNQEQALSSYQFKLFDDFNSLRHADDKLYFQDALKTNAYSGNYYEGRHFIEIVSVPFSLAFLIFFLFWIQLPCVCCRCCIKKCQKCRRDPHKKPYSSGQVSAPITFSVILGVVTFLIAIFGNQTNTEFVQSYDYALCELAQLHSQAVYGLGNSTHTWTGTQSVISEVNSASSGLSDLYSEVSNTFGSTVDFASNGDIESQLTTITNLFSSTSQRSINTDPATGNSLQVPYLFDVGSASNSTSKVGVLDTQRISIIGNYLTAIVNLKTKAEAVTSAQSTINTAFTNTATNLDVFQTEVSANGQNFLHQESEKEKEADLLKLMSFGYFVSVSFFLCILFVGVMLVKICGISCCRALIHIGWIFFSWLAIAGFLLTMLIIVARFAMQDFCESEATLVTSSNISQVKAFEQSAQYFNDCLDSSTSPTMADNLGISSSLTLLSDLNTQNTDFYSNQRTSIATDAYTQLTSYVTEVTGFISTPHLLLRTENGVTQSQSWNQAMSTLQSTANSDCSAQSANQEFVGQSSECTHTLNGSLGTAACIVVPDFQSTSTRYDSCTSSGSNIKNLIQRAKDALSELTTKLNSLKQELDSTSSNSDLADVFGQVRTSRANWLSSQYTAFNSQVTDTSGAVYLSSNNESGLVGQFSCGWIGTRYDSFSNAFCKYSKYNFGTVVVLVFIVAFLCFLMSCCGGCMAIRISAELKQKIKYRSFNQGKREDRYLEQNTASKIERF